MSSDRFDEQGDASRRTLLASERTLLAWLRTGLTVLAVALAVGKIAPDVAGTDSRWPFALLGAGYAILGLVVLAYGMWRSRAVDRAVRVGGWVNLDDRAMWGIGVATMLLAVATAVLILVDA